jgi:hypothetical protein
MADFASSAHPPSGPAGTQPATPPLRGLLRYHATLEREILDLQRELYPFRRQDLVAPRWRWMFLESAARLGVEPMVWVYRGRQRVLAHQGAIPVTVKIGATEHVTGWFVETPSTEEVRGTAIGPMLIQKALADLPFNLSLGQTPDMRAIQLAMGWRQVAPLPTYVFVLRADRMLERRIPNRRCRALVAGAITGLQRVRYLAGRRLRGTLEAGEVSRFGERHDRLWARVGGSYACAVVRDASYLNWRYVDQPGQTFVRLELRQGDRSVAVAVLTVREPDAAYRYRRALVVDLVVPADDADVLWTTFDEIRLACERLDVDLISCDLRHPRLERSIRAFGFVRRRPRRVLLVAVPDDASPLAAALSADSWLVTGGDADIDRP